NGNYKNLSLSPRVTRLFPEILTSEKPDGRTPIAPGQRVGRTVTKESSGKPDQPMRRPAQVAPNGRTAWCGIEWHVFAMA
ncbi:MAG: hypothetical protein WB500_04935, partial [Rhodoplanes sp.]